MVTLTLGVEWSHFGLTKIYIKIVKIADFSFLSFKRGFCGGRGLYGGVYLLALLVERGYGGVEVWCVVWEIVTVWCVAWAGESVGCGGGGQVLGMSVVKVLVVPICCGGCGGV